jgi:hypothetical protein
MSLAGLGAPRHHRADRLAGGMGGIALGRFPSRTMMHLACSSIVQGGGERYTDGIGGSIAF